MTDIVKNAMFAAAISTHTPHTRHDRGHGIPHSFLAGFLLTRLIRGMTLLFLLCPTSSAISTHTPHTRHDGKVRKNMKAHFISTHTPHTRHDWLAGCIV